MEGKLILISPDTARDPKKYLDVLQKNKVTVLTQTPTAFYNLIGEVKNQGDITITNTLCRIWRRNIISFKAERLV